MNRNSPQIPAAPSLDHPRSMLPGVPASLLRTLSRASLATFLAGCGTVAWVLVRMKAARASSVLPQDLDVFVTGVVALVCGLACWEVVCGVMRARAELDGSMGRGVCPWCGAPSPAPGLECEACVARRAAR